MNIFQHLARAAAEMLMQKDPYPDKYEPPQVTGKRQEPNRTLTGQPRPGCRTVYTVRAMNYRDATKPFEGTTPAGDRSIVATRVGHNRWEVSTEEWDTEDL